MRNRMEYANTERKWPPTVELVQELESRRDGKRVCRVLVNGISVGSGDPDRAENLYRSLLEDCEKAYGLLEDELNSDGSVAFRSLPSNASVRSIRKARCKA